MKAFLITDTHFGIYPLTYDKWLKMMKDYFYNFFIPLLKEKSEPGDVLIHLGDLYDNRTQIPIDVLNSAEEIMVEISEILPVHLLIGNHDIFQKSSNEINSPKSLRWVPNITIYEETTQIEVGGKKVLMMPWVEHKKVQQALLKEHSGCDYLFCHSDLNGCKMHLKSVAHRNFNKVDVEDFGGYGKVYSGHIHIVQRNKNFTFIGSPYQMDRNDMGDQKGVFIVDFETGKEEFVPNDYSPQFVKVSIKDDDDVEKLERVDTTKDYVDLSVSNSLLINNRKVRRKLEMILEDGGFSKVDYINDIVKEDKSNEDISDDVYLDDVNFSNFEEIISKYIDNLKYDSDKIRDGVKNEFENIMNLYKEQNNTEN